MSGTILEKGLRELRGLPQRVKPVIDVIKQQLGQSIIINGEKVKKGQVYELSAGGEVIRLKVEYIPPFVSSDELQLRCKVNQVKDGKTVEFVFHPSIEKFSSMISLKSLTPYRLEINAQEGKFTIEDTQFGLGDIVLIRDSSGENHTTFSIERIAVNQMLGVTVTVLNTNGQLSTISDYQLHKYMSKGWLTISKDETTRKHFNTITRFDTRLEHAQTPVAPEVPDDIARDYKVG
jgi:hypothetical protein